MHPTAVGQTSLHGYVDVQSTMMHTRPCSHCQTPDDSVPIHVVVNVALAAHQSAEMGVLACGPERVIVGYDVSREGRSGAIHSESDDISSMIYPPGIQYTHHLRILSAKTGLHNVHDPQDYGQEGWFLIDVGRFRFVRFVHVGLLFFDPVRTVRVGHPASDPRTPRNPGDKTVGLRYWCTCTRDPPSVDRLPVGSQHAGQIEKSDIDSGSCHISLAPAW